MTKNSFYIVIALFFLSLSTQGQQTSLDNQYHINPFVLSPAFAGHSSNFELFLSHRNSWVGVDGAPKVNNINLNGSINKKMGIGGSVTNDEIGIFRNFSASLAYSYELTFSQFSRLRFGISAGIYESNINAGSSILSDNQDPVIQAGQSVSNTLFDLSFGANYQLQKWNIGFVIPQLIESEATEELNDNSLFTLTRHYTAYINYNYALSKKWTLKPTAIIRTTDSSPLLVEFGALVNYKKVIWLSSSFRTEETLVISIGGTPNHRIAFNYSYEIAGGKVGSTSNGTHEVSLGILLGSSKSSSSSIFNRSTSKATKKRPYLDWED